MCTGGAFGLFYVEFNMKKIRNHVNKYFADQSKMYVHTYGGKFLSPENNISNTLINSKDNVYI